MKHGRAIIPESTEPFSGGFVADPEGDGKPLQFSSAISKHRFRPSSDKAALRNGVVTTDRAVLDAEGRAWLAWALEEFRKDPDWQRPMWLPLIRATLFKVLGFKKEDDAATDESSASSED